jgi:hypothetical protein
VSLMEAGARSIPDDTGPHTTPSAWWTPILKDFARRISPPRVPRCQSPPSTPFNSASDAFQLHPDIASYGTTLRRASRRCRPRTPRRWTASAGSVTWKSSGECSSRSAPRSERKSWTTTRRRT